MISAGLRTGFWIASLIVVLGCVRFEHPLADAEASIIDADLIGEWYFENDKGNPFRIQKKPESETVLEAFVEDDDRLDLILWKSGDNRYLCIECLQPPGYMLFRYQLQGADRIALYELDDAAIQRAIKTKKIAGATKWGLLEDQVIISDTSAGLRTFLEDHGKECFERRASFVVTRFSKDNQ